MFWHQLMTLSISDQNLPWRLAEPRIRLGSLFYVWLQRIRACMPFMWAYNTCGSLANGGLRPTSVRKNFRQNPETKSAPHWMDCKYCTVGRARHSSCPDASGDFLSSYLWIWHIYIYIFCPNVFGSCGLLSLEWHTFTQTFPPMPRGTLHLKRGQLFETATEMHVFFSPQFVVGVFTFCSTLSATKKTDFV